MEIIKLIKSYILYTLSAFGISLGIVAGIGVSSFNSMNLALANISNIKVGSITIFINILFLLVYIFLTNFKLKSKYLIQSISVIMFGSLINVFTYGVLGGFELTYVVSLGFLIIGTIIGGLSIGGIIHYNMITFPIESLCLLLSERTAFSFMKLRYGFDIISVTISLVISFLFDLSLYVREGTLISMIILSYAMSISKDHFNKLLLKRSQGVMNSDKKTC